MIKWGVSAMSHDAALAVYKDGEIVYASHGERYSRIKNDKNLHTEQINEALDWGEPEQVFFYENTFKKKIRQIRSQQFKLLAKQTPGSYMRSFGINAPIKLTSHHHSHAAYAMATNPSESQNSDILVIDSIGEFETLSVWHERHGKLKKAWSQIYPHSVGLWYSAMTQRLGLKPQEHEYILMGMAALGDPNRYRELILHDFFHKLPNLNDPKIIFSVNLHRGCMWWRPEITNIQDYVDIAAAVQGIYEEIFNGILSWMRSKSDVDNISIVGGCALNCVANIHAYKYYSHVWVPPNPGDAGSSIGAIYANTHERHPLRTPHLGTDIPGEYPIERVLDDLEQRNISAVASGRAEFGPRALGKRSILADPRVTDIKDSVNKLKKREGFRPFAPMILAEHVDEYFETPNKIYQSPYMQYALKCRRPDLYPGIVHIDNTSRVQTVGSDDDPDVRRLLLAWHERTGCPMLLNTSLNVRGEPLVNKRKDAVRWSELNGLTVRTPILTK